MCKCCETASVKPLQGTDIHHDGKNVFYMGEDQHQCPEGCFESTPEKTQMTGTTRYVNYQHKNGFRLQHTIASVGLTLTPSLLRWE
jgi:hypothetical protein